MRKSIFDIEIRIDINKEFDNIKKVLFEQHSIYYNGLFRSLYDYLNDDVFPVWEYKGLYMDLDDFFEKMNIDFSSNKCTEKQFLYLLEVLINIWPIAINMLNMDYKESFSKRVFGYMNINIPLIIEKMNYEIMEEGKKYVIIKRDSNVDSVLDLLPSNCSMLLLEYNDIRNNNIESKMSILKKIDKFIEEEKKNYKSIDCDTYNSIQVIVNKMGINHPIKEDPFNNFEEEELINWYDRCFRLMIHLIRAKEINNINKDRKKLIDE